MRLIRRPALIIDEKSDEVEEKKRDEFNEMLKLKAFQRNIYKDFLKRFIDECCDFEFQHMVDIDETKLAYSNFITKNRDYIKNYNCSFSLTPSDIAKIDDRFKYKSLTCCKHCKKKQFVDCCDKYLHDDRTKRCFLINLKFKKID